ncbi:uncharacterized protein LOC144136497 [Amblyomma americanum]
MPYMTLEPQSATQAGLLVGRHRVGAVMKVRAKRTETGPSPGCECTATSFRYPVEHCPSHKHLQLENAFLAVNICSFANTSVSDLPASITRLSRGKFGFYLNMFRNERSGAATNLCR